METNVRNVLKDIAAVEPSPFYLFDLDELERNIERIESEVNGAADICFAMKCNPFLTSIAASKINRIEVCSYGEYCICREDGIAAEKLLISGVLKKPDEMKTIVDECGELARYTVESIGQYALLEELARQTGKKLTVYIRLSSGNQFGLDTVGVSTILELANMTPYIEIGGIHYYSGSQKRKPETAVKELEKLDKFLLELEENFHIKMPELEYGPGIPARYFQNQEEYLDQAFFKEIRNAIASMKWKGHVTMEMGRIVAASCGHYVTRVCDIKHNDKIHYAITDGGIHQINYDGQIRGMYHPMVTVLTRTGQAGSQTEPMTGNGKWTICGCLCTVNDLLCAEQDLGMLKVGDMLAFSNVGAYSMVEGMALFLSHEFPAIYAYSTNEGNVLLRKSQNCWSFNTRSNGTR